MKVGDLVMLDKMALGRIYKPYFNKVGVVTYVWHHEVRFFQGSTEFIMSPDVLIKVS